MTNQENLSRLDSSGLNPSFAAHLFWISSETNGRGEFLAESLDQIGKLIGANDVSLVRGYRGKWQMVGGVMTAAELPYDLLSDVLDQEVTVGKGKWLASPLDPKSGRGEVLIARFGKGLTPASDEQFDSITAAFAIAHRGNHKSHVQQRRIRRLSAILDIAASWNQSDEMEELLNQMAETSTNLLQSERASIFIWDRTAKQLVGRPALGVEGGELRIPDDTGIVGQVVSSGSVRRVDVGDSGDQNQINRDVDKSLKFKTSSLLCAPLIGRDGKPFGAFEMINKIGGDFSDEDEQALVELASHASVAIENAQQTERLVSSRKQVSEQAAQGVQLIGECPAIKVLSSTIQRVADTDLALLILGENGCGKEVVAQMTHYLSSRRDEPLVAVNCAAISETLLESELFGHEKGSFTDAHEARAGKFELASGGTLFLDEIGDMSLGGQAKLLRVLEEKTVIRVGGSTPIHTDARVIAATNQNLADLVAQKKFREDLYYRLNVVTLELPPLRERLGDVLLLADYFLTQFFTKARRKVPKVSSAAKKKLQAHTWPGNVRELRNLMERLSILHQGDTIEADDLAFILSPGSGSGSPISLEDSLADGTKSFQVEFIERHIAAAGGNMTLAAKRLGLHRSNLYRKMRQLEMGGAEEGE